MSEPENLNIYSISKNPTRPAGFLVTRYEVGRAGHKRAESIYFKTLEQARGRLMSMGLMRFSLSDDDPLEMKETWL